MTSLKLNMKTLRSDLVSGFATGLFSIPEGMAYAKLTGVNPVYGLYSGMISTVVASLTTGSIMMISTLTSVVNFVSNAVVILRARYQESVSSTALKWLERYASDLREPGNLLMLAGVESHVMQKLENAGLIDQIGKENVFWGTTGPGGFLE